ncbi:MAG: HNH endonuclease [Zoogloeaceae bacterium]|nr:HNH endonuclease [Zoogloeaceae bacterium]
MSYESFMRNYFAMPEKQAVKDALIITIFKHSGNIKEFSSGEEIVSELADYFSLSMEQRNAVLERIYRKERRTVKTPLWHRLLYRAANELAKDRLITRPTETARLTGKREWLLTEKGIDCALALLRIPQTQKEIISVNSFEIQKNAEALKNALKPDHYNPFETAERAKKSLRKASIRARGFRRAVIEVYNHSCCVCGLKLCAPNALCWEVEAAHIIPHSHRGKDDLWNGIALCRLHHWAFDAGWFSFSEEYQIIVSPKIKTLPENFGKMNEYDIFRNTLATDKFMMLPKTEGLYPDKKSIEWHRKNILCN